MIISTNTGETILVAKLPSYDAMFGCFFAIGKAFDRSTMDWAKGLKRHVFSDYQLNPEFNANKRSN